VSWSLSVSGKELGELLSALEEKINEPGTEQLATAEAQEQARTAKSLAFDLAKSYVIGGPEKRFNVYLSGHANESHEPRSGWSNDTVTVTVSQA
jgi:hypothetical protein